MMDGRGAETLRGQYQESNTRTNINICVGQDEPPRTFQGMKDEIEDEIEDEIKNKNAGDDCENNNWNRH
jgi:hypothetical protein